MDRVIHRKPVDLPPSFTAKIKNKSLPGKPRWIFGPRSCLWKLQPVPNTSVWDAKMMWSLAAAQCQQECSDCDFCCPVLSLPCWHCRQSPFLILTASPHALNELTWKHPETKTKAMILAKLQISGRTALGSSDTPCCISNHQQTGNAPLEIPLQLPA